MASNIDATQPPAGAATTAAMRANMAAAKSEIEAIQAIDALPFINTIAAFGDSFASNNEMSSAAPYRYTPLEGGLRCLNMMAGNPCNIVTRGVGGQTSVQIAARVSDVVEPYAVVYLGTNDINNAGPTGNVTTVLNNIKASLQTIADSFKARGIGYAIATIAPKGTTGGVSSPGWSGNQVIMQSEANRYIRAFAADNNAEVFEQFAPLVVADQTGFPPKALVLRDGTHLSPRGGLIVGASNLAWFINRFGDRFNTCPSASLEENYIQQPGPVKNLLDNPAFTGSGGTATPNSGNITGPIPSSWRVINSTGSQAVTCTIEPHTIDPDSADTSAGNDFVMTITGADATSSVTLLPANNDPSTRLIAGKYLCVECDIEITAQTNARWPFLRALWYYAANPGDGSPQGSLVTTGYGAPVDPAAVNKKMRMRSPSVLLQGGQAFTLSQIFNLVLNFAGAGGLTIRVSNPRLLQSDTKI